MRLPRPRRPPDERKAVRDQRADRVEERLAVPVVIAAAVSVPAVFLTVLTGGTSATVGTALNWASLAVLTAESVCCSSSPATGWPGCGGTGGRWPSWRSRSRR